MKFIIFFILFINLAISAENTDCDIVISDQAIMLATTFDAKDCLSGANKRDLDKAFKSPADQKRICDKCVLPLGKDPKAQRLPNENHKEKFIVASLNELKKGLSQTMLELMALRSNLELGIDGDDIATSCKLSDISSSAACNKVPRIAEEIEKIQQGLANEFAIFYDKKNSAIGLMDKISNPSCSIQDKDLIAVKNRYVETLLPKLVSAIKLKGLDYDSKNFSGDLSKLGVDIGDLSDHPLIGPILRDPKALKLFMNKISGKENVDELRSLLYSKDGASTFARDLKNKCKGYIDTFTLKICSSEVSDSNISIESKNEFELLIDSTASVFPPYLEKTKEGMINFCQDQKFKNALTVSFTSIQEALSQGLPEKYKELKYSTYKSEMYKNQVEDQRDILCKIADGSKSCENGTQICELYNFWKATQEPGSKGFNLLASHDQNIDKILRSLIGEPKGISVDTKNTLVSQGIYPDPVTKKFAISDTPERKTDYYKSEFGYVAPQPQTQVTNNGGNAGARTVNSKNSNNEPYTKQVSYSTDSTTTVPAVGSNLAPQSDQDVRNNLQKQILDRLNNQMSQKQIEDMVAKAYNKGRETPLTPQQVYSKTQEVFEDMPTNYGMVGGGSSSLASGGKASVSDNKEKDTRAKQMAFYKALYGGKDPAAGGTTNTVNAAGSDGDKGKVSLDGYPIVELKNDTELKIVLTDMKNAKTEEIIQLMKKHEKFILEIGGVSYTIAYDSNKQLIITPPKGQTRDPATISKLQEYILGLVEPLKDEKNQKSAKLINSALYKELIKVNYTP